MEDEYTTANRYKICILRSAVYDLKKKFKYDLFLIMQFILQLNII